MSTHHPDIDPALSPTPLYPEHRIRRHLGQLIKLAIPVTIARLGLLIMSLVDTIVVGRYSASGLAYLNIGSTVFVTLMIILIGLLTGTVVMTSHAFGRDDYRAAGHIWRSMLPYGIILGIVFTILPLFSRPFFTLTGQPDDIVVHASTISHILAIGMPAVAIQICCSFFLEGLQRPLPGMIAIIIANLINLVLDYGFVFGAFGLPELGAAGAAWTSSIIRWFLAASLLGYILVVIDEDIYGIRKGFAGWWRHSKKARNIGYAAGASQGFETSAFATMQLFAGHMGIVAAASYGITMTLLALMFMVALGLSSATAIRVGIAYGRGDRADMALAGRIGLIATMLVMFGLSLPIYFFAQQVAGFFVNDPRVIATTAALLVIMPVIYPTDGGQNAAINALRGAGETWVPTILHLFSYIGVMIPCAYFFGFRHEMGPKGLIWGIAIASLVAVCGLSTRFYFVSKKPITPSIH